MKITATRLRAELYTILDEILATGETVEVVREHGTVVLKPMVSERRTRARKPRPNKNLIVGDPDDLMNVDWTREWKPQL